MFELLAFASKELEYCRVYIPSNTWPDVLLGVLWYNHAMDVFQVWIVMRDGYRTAINVSVNWNARFIFEVFPTFPLSNLLDDTEFQMTHIFVLRVFHIDKLLHQILPQSCAKNLFHSNWNVWKLESNFEFYISAF